MKLSCYQPKLHCWILGLLIVLGSFSPLKAEEVTVSSKDRWLEIQKLQGKVTYRAPQARSARLGDRLTSVGQGLSTAKRSWASLGIDSGIGLLQVAQGTNLKVRRLVVGNQEGRITVLDVTRGQVRVKVRKFTNPESMLELKTPSGVAGVRGTDFGVNVAADGQTNIGTLEGSVEASAQERKVWVDAGFVSIIVPGEPPTYPRPLDRELDFKLDSWSREGRQIQLLARVASGNTVLINGNEVKVDSLGRLNASKFLRGNRPYYRFVVRNPLGETRSHAIWLREPNDNDR